VRASEILIAGCELVGENVIAEDRCESRVAIPSGVNNGALGVSHGREGATGASARVGRLQASKTALACEHGILHNGHTRLRIFHHEAVAPSLHRQIPADPNEDSS
jgi:hypothetical protein